MGNTQEYTSLDKRIMRVVEEIEREIYENSRGSEIRISCRYVREKLRENGCLPYSSRVIAEVVSKYGWRIEYPSDIYLVKRDEKVE